MKSGFLARLKFGQKIRFSFTAVIILMAINATVAGIAGFSIITQLQNIRKIEQIVRTLDQISISERSFSRTLSREDANQVYQLLDSARVQLGYVKDRFSVEEIGIFSSLLDDIKSNFQKYVIEKDQSAALESRAIAIGRNLIGTMDGIRASKSALFGSGELNHIISQVLDLQWEVQEYQIGGKLLSSEKLAHVANDIISFGRQARAKSRNIEEQRVFFQIVRDTRDYLSAYERYITYQSKIAESEKKLLAISEQSSKVCLAFEARIRQSIHQRTTAAGMITLLVFIFSLIFARFMATFISGQITRPVRELVDVAKSISKGERAVRATVMLDDEIGELAGCFNQMTGDLQKSEEELLAYNRNLEQRVTMRTEELTEVLDSLKRTQNQLVTNEKMAALGQLIAGIAHDINTPLGVIKSAVEYLNQAMHRSLPQLPSLLGAMDEQTTQDFFSLLRQGMLRNESLTSREERGRKKELLAALGKSSRTPVKASEAEHAAELLTNIGIREINAVIERMLLHDRGMEMLGMVSAFSSIMHSGQTIDVAIQRASKVVSALKTYSRIEQEPIRQPINIIDDIEIVLTLYHNLMRAGVEVVRDYQPLPAISGFHDELEQVWMNLIHNALQAMNFKGRLTISAHVEDGSVVVVIHDTGSGITESEGNRIFEPFFTTKPPGEGSGLGLDIVSRIVSRHQGEISFKSLPGSTTFTVSLPVDIREA